MKCFPGVQAPYELSLFTFVMSIILTLVIISGNATIVITVIKDPLRKLHNPFNYFVTNLAFSDLILGVVTMPLSMYAHFKESEKYLDLNAIKALHMSYFISATASLLSLISLSLDRLIAITYASKYSEYVTKKRCILVSVTIWIFSLSFPFIYYEWNYIGYLMFFAHSTIFVGLVLLIIISVRVRRFLKSQSNKMIMSIAATSPSGSAERFAAKDMLVEKKVTRTFLIILSAFVGFYIPAVVMIYILHFCESCNCIFRHVLRDLQFLLISANSCINPFIYALRIKLMRDSIKASFGCKSIKKRSQERQISETHSTTTAIGLSFNDLREINGDNSN